MPSLHVDHEYDDRQSPPDLSTVMDDIVKKWVPRMVKQIPESGSIYTGYGGTAYILYLLGCHPLEGEEDGRHHFEQALQVIDRAVTLVSPKRGTFLEGLPGLKALAIAIHSKLRRPTNMLLDDFLRPPKFSSPDECEVLYGRAGYLQAIIFLRKELNEPRLGRTVALPILTDIVDAGGHDAPGERGCRWRWHGKDYFGAAHGSAGIVLILSHFLDELEEELEISRNLLVKVIEGCLRLSFPSGNVPSSEGSDKDRLVHWCHGAPGWIAPVIRLVPDKALPLGEVVWKRGILKQKGLGLCHGVCGNAMTLLQMYQYTRDERWLRRAQIFAFDAVRNFDEFYEFADRPLSLFEGVGGLIWLLLELRTPLTATFAGYYL